MKLRRQEAGVKWSWRSGHELPPQQNVNKYSKENNTMYLTDSLFADDITVIGKASEIDEVTQVMKESLALFEEKTNDP